MRLLLLEALGALGLLLWIIWWTMFAGRSKGELPASTGTVAAETSPAGLAQQVDQLDR
jgi:hypothetical protein